MTNNTAILKGTVSGVRRTEYPSGTSALLIDLGSDGRTVPVTLVDPSAEQAGLVVEGAELLVIGFVARRFFRLAGATQSRTEVVADVVIPLRRVDEVEAAMRRVVEMLLA